MKNVGLRNSSILATTIESELNIPLELQQEIGAWATTINEKQCGVDWQFQIEEACVKLKRLYPKIKTG